MNSVFARSTAGLAVCALSVTLAGAAHADTRTDSSEAAASAVRLIQDQGMTDLNAPRTAQQRQVVPEVAAELEFVFTKLMTRNAEGRFIFDYDYAVQHAGIARADQFKAESQQGERAIGLAVALSASALWCLTPGARSPDIPGPVPNTTLRAAVSVMAHEQGAMESPSAPTHVSSRVVGAGE